MREAHWNAIGTNVDLLVSNAPLDGPRAALTAAIEAADRTYSRFRADSELSAVNASPGRRQEVTPLFARALETALRGARLSDGLVDPTIGRLLRLHGHDAHFGAAGAHAGGPLFISSIAGWLAIEWDPQRRLVRLPEGVELDFGATGKALIVDMAAAAAAVKLPPGGGVLISIGGDMRVAGTPPRGGWRVLMAENSRTPRTAAGEVAALHEGALATSSTTVRLWRSGRTVLHHLIDPRTGRPARGPWRTVSVAAATCVDANICSTAAIMLGTGAVEWLGRRSVPARLVSRTGEIAHIGAWSAQRAAVA